jgi:hypothetical protein
MRSRSTIGVFAVLDPVDIDPSRIIVDAVKDPMIPDPDPMPLLGRHLEGALRARFLGQEAHSLDDAFKDRRVELIEVLLRLRKNKEVIHGAS